VKSIFRRWLPAVAMSPTRRAVLGVAGIAVAGAALTGAVSTLTPADAAPAKTAAVISAVVAPTATKAAAAAAPVAAKAPAADPAAPKAVAAGAPAKPVAAPALPKEKAIGYDFAYQPNYYFCGPAATRIALTALNQWHTFDELAGELGTTTDGTDSSFDIARVLNQNLGGNVYHVVEVKGAASASDVAKLRHDVVAAITSNHPIVANVAGSATDVRGRQHSYPGHYLTIVGYGYDGDTVKIADPADTEGSGSYWMTTAAAANWFATHGYAVN
jgi:Peptidase_C39 like family